MKKKRTNEHDDEKKGTNRERTPKGSYSTIKRSTTNEMRGRDEP